MNPNRLRSIQLRFCFAIFTGLLTIFSGEHLFAQPSNPQTAQDYSNELPRIAPLSPDAALASFQVQPGFHMDLVASEPLVRSPVAMEWDETGALYVCEMRGYSEHREEGISTIAKLIDEDGDGQYDKRTTFAEGLMWPTGLYPYEGGLFVGDAPDLLYLKDTNGDGIADFKQRVLTGFGTSNVQGLMNSFRWGLDNRIHIGCSSTGGNIQFAHDSTGSSAMTIRDAISHWIQRLTILSLPVVQRSMVCALMIGA